MMDATLKAKWTAALRSGEYKQGRGTLCDAGCKSFCCIGVLGDIQGLNWGESFSRCTSTLPDDAMHGGLRSDERLELEHMNDGTGATHVKHTFSQIADFIDANH